MPISDRTRSRWLPKGLAGLAGLACAMCCLLPVGLAAGVISGAGWAAIGQALPAVAVMLAAADALGGGGPPTARPRNVAPDCSCSEHAVAP